MIAHACVSLTVSTTGLGTGGSNASAKSRGSPTVSKYGRIARPCLFLWCEHSLRHALAPGRVDGKTLCFKTQLVGSKVTMQGSAASSSTLSPTLS
ncbi:hypothetical protein GOBAR_AA17261 [Gossypium barbadense]|uniref:Uncharacterized protein n=1 Tax=Gossypium barbadense TaxID=3634 RepID=A0A2P5XJ93_GOSBA|nr:hypothetical protein GOBAR_AA17261 [Gossypium barbadense]